MTRILSFLTALAAFCMLTATASAAGPGGASAAVLDLRDTPLAGLLHDVKYKPCCYNSGNYARATPRTCYRNGGRIVPDQYCQWGYQPPVQVCCARKRRVWWSESQYACNYHGGHVVHPRSCGRY
jgi:hypothetical protein